jgi:hypothetical protein
MRKHAFAIAAVLFIAAAAGAAQTSAFNGSWTAKVPAPNGQQRLDVVFSLKVDGAKLAGTATAGGMTFDLVNTRVDGDRIAFAIDGDTGRYEGTLAGDEISMQAIYTSGENGTRKWDFVARRTDARPPAGTPSIAGAWTGDVPRGGGRTVHADFDFEVNGSTLGGTVHALDLDLPIAHGKIDGAHVSFNVGDSKGDYTGELAGDVLRMTVKYSGGETGRVTLDFVLVRATARR